MPFSEQFSELGALLLLSDDCEEVVADGEEEEFTDSRYSQLESDKEAYWTDVFPDNEDLANALREMYMTLEDRNFRRPAWKKDRPILTPDIDTQKFVGDMMFSNTYMTQRIPANWDDKE